MSKLAASRSTERGAAIFVVVLVLTLLTAIGVFAAKASSIDEKASGYGHQNLQNHYVAEYGLAVAAAELATDPQHYYALIHHVDSTKPPDTCAANQGVDAGAPPDCYHIYPHEPEATFAAQGSGASLFEDSGVSSPGSFGAADVTGDFDVEMTDLGESPIQAPGYDSSFKFFQVTLTAGGSVRPSAGATCDESSAVAAGSESMRAHLTFGPTQQ